MHSEYQNYYDKSTSEINKFCYGIKCRDVGRASENHFPVSPKKFNYSFNPQDISI